ncbi:hypothetical protein ACFFF5_08130 [Lederbergia wuyishanensis]|uniref:Uncharacterized protein n=1 Tax=Lederbergia wuyishanensis TaxID=1347903 RepID=A0ABU0D6I6_9BACI|nr:hypothetical protein [Lederbergia wuyishanensis]MCJ8008570.1 hypothetical protein [Lederbergia wuyishanensis]MDQ0344015.1 hypothetical protein [Lederbergia wuyishanensis]
MDLKSVRRYQETLIRNEEQTNIDVHYNEKMLGDFLQTLHRIETKIDVLLMQKDRRYQGE